ncbi:MAG: TetR/AcrR family transcriptional regulator [Epulopiscium sp.]|nr:TetR/AcrR family transcriptional regulator [Candidatus Epulonipiscium sp.]
MPKQTFFNLPREKQEKLMDAAKKEFSRVPLHEASISNIVKNAKIPRGSFYQYFENKEDAFFFLLKEHNKVGHKQLLSILEKTEGDLLESCVQVFQYMLMNFQDKENRSFFKNTFLNMDHKTTTAFTPSSSEFKICQYPSKIMDAIDMSKLNISDEEEFFHVLQIIKAITFHNLIQNFAKEKSVEEALQNYKYQIDLLKKGLSKK